MTRSLSRVIVAVTAVITAGVVGGTVAPAASAHAPRHPVGVSATAPSTLASDHGGWASAGVTGPGHRLRIVSGGWSVNSVTAQNGGHGHLKARSRATLVQTRATSVNATNRAVAVSHCNGCRTVAVALDVVLASGSPDTSSFTNVATALNRGCTGCETVAMAYQLVRLAPSSRLSDAGVARLNEIAGLMATEARSTAPIDEVVSAIDSLAAQAAQVLRDDVIEGGGTNANAHRSLRDGPGERVAVHRWVDRT